MTRGNRSSPRSPMPRRPRRGKRRVGPSRLDGLTLHCKVIPSRRPAMPRPALVLIALAASTAGARPADPPAAKVEPDLPYADDRKDEHKLDLYVPAKEKFST